MAGRGLIIASLVIVALGYWLYSPLPEGISEPWKVRMIMANLKIMNAVVGVGVKLGLGSELNLTRRSFDFLLSFSSDDDRVDTTDTRFDGVKVRIYRPKTEPNTILPAIVYYHGGGWALLSVDNYGSLTSHLAAEANIVVVSVDYRLAPEHPFPIPFDDCVTATVHLLRNARNYKVDPKRIGIAGDSAGGNLAAAVAIRLSFEIKLPQIKFHALFYPGLQAFDFHTPSYVTNDQAMPELISRRSVVEHWLLYYQGNLDGFEQLMVNNHTSPLLKVSEYGQYVSQEMLPEGYQLSGDKPRTDFGNETFSQKFEDFLLNPYANPLMAVEMTALSPAHLVSGEFDVFRDDTFFYARRLMEAGVNVTHKHYEAGYHGFFSFFHASFYMELPHIAVNDFVEFLKEGLRK